MAEYLNPARQPGGVAEHWMSRWRMLGRTEGGGAANEKGRRMLKVEIEFYKKNGKLKKVTVELDVASKGAAARHLGLSKSDIVSVREVGVFNLLKPTTFPRPF